MLICVYFLLSIGETVVFPKKKIFGRGWIWTRILSSWRKLKESEWMNEMRIHPKLGVGLGIDNNNGWLSWWELRTIDRIGKCLWQWNGRLGQSDLLCEIFPLPLFHSLRGLTYLSQSLHFHFPCLNKHHSASGLDISYWNANIVFSYAHFITYA